MYRIYNQKKSFFDRVEDDRRVQEQQHRAAQDSLSIWICHATIIEVVQHSRQDLVAAFQLSFSTTAPPWLIDSTTRAVKRLRRSVVDLTHLPVVVVDHNAPHSRFHHKINTY